MSVRPIGIGSAAPTTILTNSDLEGIVETSDEWIRTRTGIQQRHVLTHGETLRDLSIQAAKHALDMAGVAPEEIGLVICASSSPEDLFGDAPSIANQLGCNTDTIAYDLVAACSGFLFGVVTASQFLSAPGSGTHKALVIGADSLSRWVDWDDRNTCILFGDGAGAMVLEASNTPGILGYAAHSNGGGYCDLNAGCVWCYDLEGLCRASFVHFSRAPLPFCLSHSPPFIFLSLRCATATWVRHGPFPHPPLPPSCNRGHMGNLP